MDHCISLFKKPVLLRAMPANPKALPEDDKAFFINRHLYFIPKVVSGGVVGSAMNTLYINRHCTPADLEQALQAAMSDADKNLAGKSRRAIYAHLL